MGCVPCPSCLVFDELAGLLACAGGPMMNSLSSSGALSNDSALLCFCFARVCRLRLCRGEPSNGVDRDLVREPGTLLQSAWIGAGRGRWLALAGWFFWENWNFTVPLAIYSSSPVPLAGSIGFVPLDTSLYRRPWPHLARACSFSSCLTRGMSGLSLPSSTHTPPKHRPCWTASCGPQIAGAMRWKNG